MRKWHIPKLAAGKRPVAPPPSDTRAVIPIDGDPIRKKARKDYEKARRDLDKARLQLEQFHTQDRPAFDRWLNANFGQFLTEIRELSRQAHEQDQLLAEIESYMWSHNVSEAEAYLAVMFRRENPAAAAAAEAQAQAEARARAGGGGQPPPGFDEAGDAEDEDDLEFDARSEEEAFREFSSSFEDAFGFKIPPGMRPPDPPPKPVQTASVKELYRALVRKLHPDKQAAMTAQKLEWWHEVQEAYAANDAERLATILSLVEMSDGDPTAHTSVSVFQRLVARLKASLRDVKREVAQGRRDPAWNFTGAKDHQAAAARVGLEMRDSLLGLRRARAEHEACLRGLAQDARRVTERRARQATQNQRRRRPGAGQSGFQF